MDLFLSPNSERLFQEIADRMASDGYRDAGYDIVAMDDCWLARERDHDNKLIADVTRFPSGMKALGDYVGNSFVSWLLVLCKTTFCWGGLSMQVCDGSVLCYR